MRHQSSVIDWALLLLAVAATTFLGLSYFRPRPVAPPARNPATLARDLEGSDLPSLRLVSDSGGESRFELADSAGARLLLVFSTECSFCEQSVPGWKRLIAGAASGIEVFALNGQSATIAEDWLALNEVPHDQVVVAATPTELAEWGIPGVPATLLVRGSRVLLAEFGAFRLTALDRFGRFIDENP